MENTVKRVKITDISKHSAWNDPTNPIVGIIVNLKNFEQANNDWWLGDIQFDDSIEWFHVYGFKFQEILEPGKPK